MDCTANLLRIPTILLFLLTLAHQSYSSTRIVDDTELLSEGEKTRVEEALKLLPGSSHIRLANNFEGMDPWLFASKVYKDVFYRNTNGFVLVYSVQEGSFGIRTGLRYTHRLERKEIDLIINQLLTPAFKEGQYLEGLLNAISQVGDIFRANNELIKSNEVFARDEVLVDETGLFKNSTASAIERFLTVNDVSNDEHLISVRVCRFDPKDFVANYNFGNSSALSVSYNLNEDIYAGYVHQLYNSLFEDYLNRFQVGERKKPDLSLICIFEDRFYFKSNWEQFIEVESTTGNSHTRTLANRLGSLYQNYADVGSEESGIRLVVKKVVQLSRGEIQATSSELKPPIFSVAWLSRPSSLGLVIFSVILIIVVGRFVYITLRKRQKTD